MYTKDDLTWGFELELSNVPKNFKIPEHLGKWEYCECDIINTKGKYANICADPLGINPPFGGEINTKPTNTKEEQIDRIMEIINLFREEGFEPDCGMTAHSHIHVHIKGLLEDFESLKKLFSFVYFEQNNFINNVYDYDESKIPDGFSKIKSYLKNDGSRKIPEWLYNNIITNSKNIKDFFNLFHCGKSAMGWSNRVSRYGINFYSLKHVNTIEFRCFRGTLNKEELGNCFFAVEQFLLKGLNDFSNLLDIFEKDLQFPKMIFDDKQAKGWVDTKHKVELISKKNRKFWEVK